MLNLTNKRANYLFLQKETVIALKMSIGNILPSKAFYIYYFVLLNYKLIYIHVFFFGGGCGWMGGGIKMKSTFYETVQCYKMLHPENLTGFHNVCTVVDTPKIVLLVFGLVVLVSVTSNHY